MERFGNDKPDLRFGLELKEMADLAEKGTFKVFLDAVRSGGRVKAINGKGMASLSRKEIDMLTEEAQSFGAKGPRMDKGEKRLRVADRKVLS